MNNRLPWWLFVILGWGVVLFLPVEYFLGMMGIALSSADANLPPGSPDPWWETLKWGAVITALGTLMLTVALVRAMYSTARAHRGGCVFTIAAPLLVLILLVFLIAVLNYLNLFVVLYYILGG